jgi:hypothetical protein
VRYFLMILFTAIPVLFISCIDSNDPDECTHKPASCHSTPYSYGTLTVKYILNSENPSITIKIYQDTINGTLVQTIPNVNSGTSYDIVLPFGTYAAQVVYQYGAIQIEAVDSDKIESESDEYCEGTCYSVKNGEVNCAFDEEAFKEYKSGNDSKCFIATAAYGSSFSPKVKVLRNFRDAYLLTNAAGRGFVSWYYRISPPIADVIAKDDRLRMITRGILTPIVFVIEYPRILVLMFIVFVGLFILRRYRLSS